MYKTIIAEDGQKYNLVPVDEIKTTPAQAPQKKKWEPKGGEWYVNGYGFVCNSDSHQSSRLFGIEYPTKELAEKARDAMRIHNLLLSRKMEECPNEGDCYLYRYSGVWSIGILCGYNFYPDTVLFTRKVAEKICEELKDPDTNFLNV